MKYIVTVYTGSKVYDEFYTYDSEAAERQAGSVAKWASYYHPDTMVITTIKQVEV